jgi:hypothetical protein
LRPGRRRRENDHRRGIEEFPAMMFPDSENVQAHLVGKFNPLDEIADAVRGTDRDVLAIVRQCRRKAVNADLHRLDALLQDRLSVFGLTSLIRFK